MEIWRTVEQAKRYEVSDLGRVRHAGTGRIKNPTKNKGRLMVCLSQKTKTQNFYISRLVALAFLPRPSHPHPVVRHRNEDLDDNRATNLVWALHPKIIGRDAENKCPVLGEWRYPFEDYEGS